MRASLTAYLGFAALIIGVASGVEFHAWHWPFYGVLGALLIWSSAVIAPPAPSVCKFCGREESAGG